MDKKANISFNIRAVISLVLFGFAVSPVYLQNDAFYTIKIGQYILEHGIDMKDHFSWHEDLPYTYPHWAYDVFIGFLYNTGGFAAVVISTIVLACFLGIIVYFINCSLTGNRVTSLLFALLVLFLLGDSYITARAQIVSYILLVLEFFCIEKFLKTKHFGYAVALFAIATVLANVHIAVWLFFFILFLPYAGEYLLAKLKDLKQLQKISFLFKPFSRITIEKDRAVPLLIVVAGICLVTGLFTPLGFTPYTYLYKSMAGPSLGYIDEHRSLLIVTSLKFVFVFMLLFLFLFLTNTKVSIKNLFIIGGFVALSLIGKRHFALLAVIGMPVFNLLACKCLKEDHPSVSETVQKFILTLKGTMILSSVIITVTVLMTLPKLKQDFYSRRIYPEGASDYIIKNLDVENMKLFNEYVYGSYLLFRGIPVFVDSRAELYTKMFNGKKDILTDYMDVNWIRIFYGKKFEEYGVTHVIQKKDSSLGIVLAEDKNYREIYSDSYFVLFERISGSKCP